MVARLLTACFLAASLTACASAKRGTFAGDGDTRGIREAVTTPISDLNIENIEIPPYLADLEDPYLDAPQTCREVNVEIALLNNLLGPDINVPEGKWEKRNQSALNATSSVVGGLMPFRGVVRTLSGASSQERRARDAYERGLVRRAYLKGIAEEAECPL